MTTKYFIIREAKCDENKVYARSFPQNTTNGYKNLEEAKNELKKINEIEQLKVLKEEKNHLKKNLLVL